MLVFLFWSAIGFLAGVGFGSFFEWTLHRYFMHRPSLGWRYPFEKHALIHHHIFRADQSYHLKEEKDKRTIPMASWNGPAIVATCLIPFLVFATISHQWGVLGGAAVAFTVYFTAYEYLHWCMHLPRQRHVERSGIFFRLNGHHLLHHRYMHKNFNVVFPLADLLLGTLLLRSKLSFPQARGAAVPDVQPRAQGRGSDGLSELVRTSNSQLLVKHPARGDRRDGARGLISGQDVRKIPFFNSGVLIPRSIFPDIIPPPHRAERSGPRNFL